MTPEQARLLQRRLLSARPETAGAYYLLAGCLHLSRAYLAALDALQTVAPEMAREIEERQCAGGLRRLRLFRQGVAGERLARVEELIPVGPAADGEDA